MNNKERVRESKGLSLVEFNSVKYSLDNRGYYRRTWHKAGQGSFLHQAIWEFHNGAIPKGYVIHHKDGDKTNNAIENLECLTQSEHISKHRVMETIANPPLCLLCGKELVRRQELNGRWETPHALRKRRYCNRNCWQGHKIGKPFGWCLKHGNAG